MVTVDDAPMAHTGPTLPSDFPAHLLLRICDAILAPLLNPYSPIKPYTKPWSRSAPSPWNAQAQSTTASMSSFLVALYGGPLADPLSQRLRASIRTRLPGPTGKVPASMVQVTATARTTSLPLPIATGVSGIYVAIWPIGISVS